MSMEYESGVIDSTGMEFGLMDDIQPILEKAFTECIKYQLTANPLSAMIYAGDEQPEVMIQVWTDAFTTLGEPLVFQQPLRELIEQELGMYTAYAVDPTHEDAYFADEPDSDHDIMKLRNVLQKSVELIDHLIIKGKEHE